MKIPTWETPYFLYPKNQLFISTPFRNSNIRSYGSLHRFSSLYSAEAIGTTLVVANKFSNLPSANKNEHLGIIVYTKR